MSRIVFLLVAIVLCLVPGRVALALEPVDVNLDKPALDLSQTYDLNSNAGSAIKVTTAPDADGVVNRIEVRSSTSNGSGRMENNNNSNKSSSNAVMRLCDEKGNCRR